MASYKSLTLKLLEFLTKTTDSENDDLMLHLLFVLTCLRCSKIMLAIDSLPSEYHMLLPDNANSLGEWLNALKLAQYTALFIQHGFTNLDSVKGLYGLELDQVRILSVISYTTL